MPGCGRSSTRLAAMFLEANPDIIDCAPSKSTIHRILQENSLKPHRSKYFLQISDPHFFPKMEHLISLYLTPPKNLYCFDECPGIQVLQRLAQDMRTEKTKISLEEFEYIRHGTMDVMAFLEVSSGKASVECRSNHDSETFVKVFRGHLNNAPSEEPLHYVMDNLNTHCCYGFCELIAEYSNICCPPETDLNTMEKRREWLTNPGRRVSIHFTPFHGSWLNMIEIWFGILNKKCLRETYSTPDAMREAILLFTELWNTLLAHPFNWSYTGKGLHAKAVKRFINSLNHIDQVDIRPLTKQLLLMHNMLMKYYDEVGPKIWAELLTALFRRHNEIVSRIEADKGPKRREKAKLALKSLLRIIVEIESAVA